MDSRFSSQPSSHDQSFNYSSSGRQSAAPPYPASHRLPTSIPASHTLPPLSSHTSAYPYSNDPSPQRTQNTQPVYFSGSSGSSNHNGPFPIYPPTATTQFQPQNFPPSSTRSLQSPSNYSQSWGPQTSTPQTYQSYNSPTGSSGLPNLLPMPNSQLNQQNTVFHHTSPTTVNAGYNAQREQRQPQEQQQQQQQQQQSQPTHVVGSQGRRGILPSATGRPAAVVNGSAANQKPASTPAKDAEGKFPCEHCHKNYLHAKHLKRHLLRHTGVRPYSCGLCEDTFSRSDILKRHFQKCSVRRGNPTGASHLTHSKNSKKGKPHPIEQLTIPLSTPVSSSSAPSSQGQHSSHTASSTPTLQSPFDLQGLSNLGIGTAAYQEELQNFSNRASRANSIKRSSNGMTASSRTTSGPSSIAGPDSAFAYSTGQVTPDSLTTSGAATPYSIQHDGRLPFSPDANYHATNGSNVDLNNISRPHSGPAYTASSQPHIIGSANGSRHDLEAFFTNSHDEMNHHYSPHHDYPHHNIKPDPDFSNVQYTMNGSYSQFDSK